MTQQPTADRVRDILRTREVATEYGIPEGTLRFMRHNKTGPASFKLGRNVVYRRGEIERWIAEQEAKTSQGGAPMGAA